MKLHKTKKHLNDALKSVPMNYQKIKTKIKDTLRQIKVMEEQEEQRAATSKKMPISEQWKFDPNEGRLINPMALNAIDKLIEQEMENLNKLEKGS
jgi:hypothetical protein